jgi:hypothetical protein
MSFMVKIIYHEEHEDIEVNKIIKIGDNLEFYAHRHLEFSNSILASLGYKG